MSTPPDPLAVAADVQWPDHDAETAVARHLDRVAGAGRLAEIARWLAATGGGLTPTTPSRPRLVLFAAPDGHVAELAETVGAGVRTLALPDAAPIGDAVAAGIAAADEEVERGADLLVAACPGQQDPAAALVSALTGAEPVALLARGAAATDPLAWMARAVRVRDTRRQLVPLRERPGELLVELGSAALAAACGFVLQAAVRRTPVILDGSAVAAAAVLVYETQPRAMRWWAVADGTGDPAAERAHTQLGLAPLLALGTDLGDGTAGLLCVPILRAAAGLARAAAAA
jgi:nicotinate-nucleotide--dimethylbenzimidazole phosphoribosyltransferase